MGPIVRWCWILAGLGLAVVAFLSDSATLVPDSDTTAFVLWVLAAASILTGVASGFGRRAGLLAGFLALTTGARLLLVQPLWLQSFHVSPWALRQGLRPVAVLVILIQAALMVSHVRGRMGRWIANLRPVMFSWRGVLALAILIGASAHASLLVAARESPDFARKSIEFALQFPLVAFLVSLDLSHLAWIGGALDASALERWKNRWGSRLQLPCLQGEESQSPRPWDRRVPYALAAGVLVL
ncbi:MAG TPA: hypothetical protein ENK43_14740, partial [Planctomycetes bacterium]|nr:hypothetical protein [Planctomycetota bacterium]